MKAPNRIATDLWHCHDGWAGSVAFVVNGQTNHELHAIARKLWAERFESSWYESSPTRAEAKKKLMRQIAIAKKLLPQQRRSALESVTRNRTHENQTP